MRSSPFTLANRFRLATTADIPAIRKFFSQHLDDGGALFDQLNPLTRPMIGVCIPLADVWIVTVRRNVIAAGWFALQQAGAVQVVALTDPQRDEFTGPLLAYIKAALQVIAHEQKMIMGPVAAWLPGGPHQSRLSAAYHQGGWTPTHAWTAHLHRAHLQPQALRTHLDQALAAGIDIRPHPAPDPHATAEPIYAAYLHGQPIAVNSTQHHDHATLLPTRATWLTTSTDPNLIDQALTASVLLGRPTLPDLLAGTDDLTTYQAWFTGFLDVERHDGYTLTIDPSREPTPWEFALGFNPRRFWMII